MNNPGLLLADDKRSDKAVSRAILHETPILIFSLGLSNGAVLNRLFECVWSSKRALILADPKKFADHLRYEPIYTCVRPGLGIAAMWLIASRLDSHLRREGKRLGVIILGDITRMKSRSSRRKLRLLARTMKALLIVLPAHRP